MLMISSKLNQINNINKIESYDYLNISYKLIPKAGVRCAARLLDGIQQGLKES